MRAVCYARVSSAQQRDKDTIASQLRVLPEFVERHGWTLVKPVDTYVDDGRTAKAGHLERRDGLSALLRDAAALGIPSANGLSMLVHQGAKALEIWSDLAASETAPVMSLAAHAALAGR